MATIFYVDGPYKVPMYDGKASRTITDDNVKEFWRQNPHLKDKRGAYVFGIRAGKGLTPGYAGKATKTFKGEVFQHHKLTRYQQFVADYRKGTPVLFFVVLPTRRGTPNATHIGELEDFLIQTALAANPNLMNVRGTKKAQWGIAGLLRGGKGKPSSDARLFRRLMKLPARK
jgi:hypothetical protein